MWFLKFMFIFVSNCSSFFYSLTHIKNEYLKSMIKNIEIKPIEAKFLRDKITQRLMRETSEQPKFTSYLNGYGGLNESIKKCLISEEEFSSENLLRKLLSESINDESVTFRIGFLDACYRYITESKHNRASYLSKNKNREEANISFKQRYWKFAIIGITCLVLAIASIIYLYNNQKVKIIFNPKPGLIKVSLDCKVVTIVSIRINNLIYSIKQGESTYIYLEQANSVIELWECRFTPTGCKWNRYEVQVGDKYSIIDDGDETGMKLIKQ